MRHRQTLAPDPLALLPHRPATHTWVSKERRHRQATAHPSNPCRVWAGTNAGKKIVVVDGDQNETRVFARLPGLDIAVVHRAGQGNGGEQLAIALRAVPSPGAHLRPTAAADPFLLWARLMQAAWTSWLAYLAMASAPPWIAKGQ